MRGSDGYSYAVGKVKALESKLMDPNAIQRMIDAPDFEEALRFLGDTDYSGKLGKSDFEAAVSEVIREVNIEVASFSPDPYFTGMFHAGQDFLRLKAALKGELLARAGLDRIAGVPDIYGWTPREETDSIAHAAVEDEQDSPASGLMNVEEAQLSEADRLSRSLKQAAFSAVRGYRAQGGDPLEIDIAIDREFFAYLSDMASSRRAVWAQKLLAARADMANIMLVIRAAASGKDPAYVRSAIVPGGSFDEDVLMGCSIEGEPRIRRALEGSAYWGRISAKYEEWARDSAIRPLEMAFERLVSGIEKEAKVVTEGYVPVMGYLLMKQRESEILR
nr:V-type ATPase subunit [Bacillota bacterium]